MRRAALAGRPPRGPSAARQAAAPSSHAIGGAPRREHHALKQRLTRRHAGTAHPIPIAISTNARDRIILTMRAAAGAERHPHADLPRASRHGIGQQTVQTCRRQQQADAGEARHEQREKSRRGHSFRQNARQCADVVHGHLRHRATRQSAARPAQPRPGAASIARSATAVPTAAACRGSSRWVPDRARAQTAAHCRPRRRSRGRR